jgi:hypothetical protein
MLGQLGPRPRQAKLRAAILALTERQARSPVELARWLGLADASKLVERHLSPMVKEGQLLRSFPDNPAHPEQAYRASQAPLQPASGQPKPR